MALRREKEKLGLSTVLSWEGLPEKYYLYQGGVLKPKAQGSCRTSTHDGHEGLDGSTEVSQDSCPSHTAIKSWTEPGSSFIHSLLLALLNRNQKRHIPAMLVLFPRVVVQGTESEYLRKANWKSVSKCSCFPACFSPISHIRSIYLMIWGYLW